jgi:hypothetical protein
MEGLGLGLGLDQKTHRFQSINPSSDDDVDQE